MANFHINQFELVDGSVLDIYVNGTTSATEVVSGLTKFGGNIKYDFSDVNQKLQGKASFSFSNVSDVFDTNYTEFKNGIWIIHIDSVEIFRGKPDLNSFGFDRKSRMASFNIFDEGMSEIGVDFSSLTTHTSGSKTYYSASEWLDKIVLDTIGLTVDYDIASEGLSFNKLFFVKSDAGATDLFFLLRKLDNAENTRVGNILSMFGLNFALWDGSMRIFERDQFFSDTVVISSSDAGITKLTEHFDHEIKDFSFNSYVKNFEYEDIDIFQSIPFDNFITLATVNNKYQVISPAYGVVVGGDNASTIGIKTLFINSFDQDAYFTLVGSSTQSTMFGETIKVAIKYQIDTGGWNVDLYVMIGTNKHVFTAIDNDFNPTDFNMIEFDINIADASTSNIEIGFEQVTQEGEIFSLTAIAHISGSIAQASFADSNHGLLVDDIIRISDTTNFNGEYTVTEINVGGADTEVKITKSFAGTPATEFSGTLYKNPSIITILFDQHYIFKTNKETVEFTNSLDISTPVDLKFLDKNTSVVKTLDGNQNFQVYGNEVATIYNNRIGSKIVHKVNMTIKKDSINPFSRITLDGINFLINKFEFDIKTFNKKLELIKE